MRRFFVIFAVAANLTLVDAVTKEMAAGCLKGAAAISVIPGFFDLTYTENRGCAWGMLQGQVWPLAIFAMAALGLLIWKRRSVFDGSILIETMLYAGIIGNAIDRIFRGYVIDMLDFHWRNVYHFPCFNLADCCITVAAALLILKGLKK